MTMDQLTSSTANLVEAGAYSTSTRTLFTDYTELMGGSVSCPSCKGSGKIPRELEETLVALIPVNDERLKPKRTCVYVLLGIISCLVFAVGVIFLMVPRTVAITSNQPPIELISVFSHDEYHISFHFLNYVNISNANYYSIKVINTTSTIISKFQPWSSDVIGSGGNNTAVIVGAKTQESGTLYFNNTVTIKGGVAFNIGGSEIPSRKEQCSGPLTVLLYNKLDTRIHHNGQHANSYRVFRTLLKNEIEPKTCWI